MSDFALPGLAGVASWLAAGAREKSRRTGETARPIGPRPLRQLQIVIASPKWASDESLHLMVDAMGPDSLIFKTGGRLHERQMLELETLLDGLGTLRVNGVVDWLLLSPAGLRGEIRLESTIEQQAWIETFLMRQEHRVR